MSGEIAPSANPFLAGHSAAIAAVVDAFSSGRMHHAWLICGMDGIGKATLAFHIAHFILSAGANRPGNLDMRHQAARLIAAEAHPDLFILRRKTDEKTGAAKNSIAVEDARAVNEFMHKTAAYGGWRVVIIDEAHALNNFGQNAILKFVEEPPERTVILITARSRGSLLPTIRSRCRLLPLSPLSDAEMREALARCGAGSRDPQDVERVIRLSEGSVGFASCLLNSDSLPFYDEILGLIKDMPRFDVAKAHVLADKLARKSENDNFPIVMRLLGQFLWNETRALAMGGGGEGKAVRISADVGGAVRLRDAVAQTLEMAERSNLDRKLAFLNVLSILQSAKAA